MFTTGITDSVFETITYITMHLVLNISLRFSTKPFALELLENLEDMLLRHLLLSHEEITI